MKDYFKFKCVYCGQNIECETHFSGRQTKCPSCNHKMVVPPAPGQKSASDGPNTINTTWNTRIDDPDVTVPTRSMERGQQPSGSAKSKSGQ
jgi:DNA-directed RNA polymerase subunit RPC12/RpoP